jgi:hypothetical protein
VTLVTGTMPQQLNNGINPVGKKLWKGGNPMLATLVGEVEEQALPSLTGTQTQAAAAFCPVCFSDQVCALYEGGVYCLECNQRSGPDALRR